MLFAAVLSAAALLAVALPGANAVPGNFQAALSDYRAGHYEAAHAQFLSLAELGDCSSQFNLGAMALHGQGGPKDRGSGAGWLQAAAAIMARSQQQLALQKARGLGWNTGPITERLDAYRHGQTWRGDLLASP